MGFKSFVPVEEEPSEVKSLETIQKAGISVEREIPELSTYSTKIILKLAKEADESRWYREKSDILNKNFYAIFEKIAKDEEKRKELIAQFGSEIENLKEAYNNIARALTESIKKSMKLFEQLNNRVKSIEKVQLEQSKYLEREIENSERRLRMYSDDYYDTS